MFYAISPCDLYDGVHPKTLLGHDFLYFVGSVMDLPRRRMCLTYIDSRVFYYALPPHAIHVTIQQEIPFIPKAPRDEESSGSNK